MNNGANTASGLGCNNPARLNARVVSLTVSPPTGSLVLQP